MKKIIAVLLVLMYITSVKVNAAEDSAWAALFEDTLLICWAEYPGTVNTGLKETVSIILNFDDKIATMIDPHNEMVTGNLTVSEYFYTITIKQLIYSSKIGVIKINRLSGVLSAVWTAVKTVERPVPDVDAKYGACDLADRKQLF